MWARMAPLIEISMIPVQLFKFQVLMAFIVSVSAKEINLTLFIGTSSASPSTNA